MIRHGASLGARMAVLAMLPVAYLFASLLAYAWYAQRNAAEDELAEKGRALAQAMAHASEYNLISGNLSDLRQTLQGLVQNDADIQRIDVLDTRQKALIQSVAEDVRSGETRYFEAPVRKQVVWINLFSDNGTPHVTAAGIGRPPALTSETVGFVRVTMSPGAMAAKQRARFMVELAMAALALGVASLLAWTLARRLIAPLRRAILALRQIRSGEYLVRLPVDQGGELGELQASIGEMSVALARSKQDLENQVAERTRELSVSRDEALQANADKRKLLQRMHSVVEEERQSIAVEIHDELNAALIAARLEAQAIAQLAAEAPTPALQAEIRAKAEAIARLTLDLYASGRRLVRRLRPEVLEMLGLQGAIEEMLRQYQASAPGCSFHFQAHGDFAGLDHELAISAYRIVQEALSNVLKHAHANKVLVALTHDPEGGVLDLEVSDNGDGFDAATRSEGIGLIGMRERVAARGGSFRIETAPQAGTTLTISLPLA
ncbi:ATP-binding protein [Massilia sp. TS11]|uniref:ATP-binding protein n=1 Tax=Massilia sp. TS11 TaxID=2908003 RepID=UPI001EDB4135|nr:ATP-binding protein [Massilia sp. TS11]MCG2584809.1 histidine kinase [Massilia sp. TS11]